MVKESDNLDSKLWLVEGQAIILDLAAPFIYVTCIVAKHMDSACVFTLCISQNIALVPSLSQ